MANESLCIVNSDEISRAGFIQLSTLVLLDPELSDAQVRLYGVLLDFARQEGFCYPRVATLMKMLRCSDRTIQRNMDALISRGLVIRRSRVGRSNVYDLSGFRHAYGEGVDHNTLKPEVLTALEEAGKDRFVKSVRDTREVIEQTNTGDQQQSCQRKNQKPEKQERRFDAALEQAQVAQKQSELAQQRRSERRKRAAQLPSQKKVQSKQASPFSTRDFEAEWRMKMSEKFPGIPGVAAPWEVKHKSMVKRLGERFSADGVSLDQLSDAFMCIIDEWDDFVDRYGVKGYPSVQRIVYFADTWVPEVLGKKRIDPRGKREQAMSQRNWSGRQLNAEEVKGGGWFFDKNPTQTV